MFRIYTIGVYYRLRDQLIVLIVSISSNSCCFCCNYSPSYSCNYFYDAAIAFAIVYVDDVANYQLIIIRIIPIEFPILRFLAKNYFLDGGSKNDMTVLNWPIKAKWPKVKKPHINHAKFNPLIHSMDARKPRNISTY
jgi:hypothetical protein